MEILGNICFSEQIFYGKQSLGAPANHYPMMQEPNFRLTFLAQKRYCLLLSALLLQVALVKSGSSHLLGVFIGIPKCSFRVKKIYKKKFISYGAFFGDFCRHSIDRDMEKLVQLF